jgi:hypothetical protein
VLVRLQLPLRNYLIVETSPEGLRSIQGPSEVFVRPSLIAAKDRSVLAVGTSMANRLCRIHEPNHEERRCPRFRRSRLGGGQFVHCPHPHAGLLIHGQPQRSVYLNMWEDHDCSGPTASGTRLVG